MLTKNVSLKRINRALVFRINKNTQQITTLGVGQGLCLAARCNNPEGGRKRGECLRPRLILCTRF